MATSMSILRVRVKPRCKRKACISRAKPWTLYTYSIGQTESAARTVGVAFERSTAQWITVQYSHWCQSRVRFKPHCIRKHAFHALNPKPNPYTNGIRQTACFKKFLRCLWEIQGRVNHGARLTLMPILRFRSTPHWLRKACISHAKPWTLWTHSNWQTKRASRTVDVACERTKAEWFTVQYWYWCQWRVRYKPHCIRQACIALARPQTLIPEPIPS